MKWLALLLGVALASSLGCGACDRGAELPVRKVLVDVEPSAASVDREMVRGIVEKMLKGTRGVELVEGTQEAAVVRVRIEGFGPIADGDAEVQQELRLSVEATNIPGEPDAGTLRGQARVALPLGSAVETLVERGLQLAIAEVLMTRGAADLSSKQLVAWLLNADSSLEQKRRATRVLGVRKEKAAVDALTRILLNGDDELRPLALSALANIGDPGAVDAVILYSDGLAPLGKRKCIEAVRNMGSPRGKPWLFTLSTGHPDPDVQREAADALAVLESQDPEGEAVAEGVRPPPSEVIR